MMTQIIASSAVDERVYKTVLDNGLTVLVCERPDRVGANAVLAVGVGSASASYEENGHRVSYPAGTAHFLEHMMFAGRKTDAMTEFARLGSACNAFTAVEKTCYTASANNNILPSVDALIRFVAEPYFTERRVRRERSIIGEEISMYADNVYWQLVNGGMSLIYHNHPCRDDIAGNSESISQITAETLYQAYRAFYRPSSMTLSVSGRVKNEEILELAERILGSKPHADAHTSFPVDEPLHVVADSKQIFMPVGMTQCAIFYKEPPIDNNRLPTEMLVDIILDTVFGETTDFYRIMYDSGLINQSFSTQIFVGESHFCTALTGETPNPEKLRDAINNEIERVKQNGLDRDRFAEVVRSRYGDEILDFDSNSDIAYSMAALSMRGHGPFDVLEMLKTVAIEDADKLIQNLFVRDRSAMLIIKPIERI